jgi:regulatory protein RepA
MSDVAAPPLAYPEKMDFTTLLEKEPEPLPFVLPGLVRGKVGAFVSPGGMGKSQWILQLAAAMAAGREADLTGLAPEKGKLFLLSGEDDKPVLAERMYAIFSRVSSQSMTAKRFGALMEKSFACLPTAGFRMDALDDRWMARTVEAARGFDLIVIDTLTRFHTLDENSSRDMTRLVAALENLAFETNAAVLYLHHTSKVSALSGGGATQQAARGSSVLIDNVRWAAYLAPMTVGEARQFRIPEEDRASYVRWNLSKHNYVGALADRWYLRNEDGLLMPARLTKEQPEAPRAPATFEGFEQSLSDHLNGAEAAAPDVLESEAPGGSAQPAAPANPMADIAFVGEFSVGAPKVAQLSESTPNAHGNRW